MLSKKILGLITALLVTLGLGVPQAANADSLYSTPASSAASSWETALIPINDQASLLVWTTYDNGSTALKSARLAIDGTVSEPIIIDQGADTTFAIQSKTGWTQLPDGTIALSWVSSVHTQASGVFVKTVKVAYTSDGQEWTQAVSPFESVSTPDASCEYGACSYQSARLTSDKFGTLAVAVQSLPAGLYSDSVLLLKTSTNGTSWSSATAFSKQVNSLEIRALSALPSGGFVAVWSEYFNQGLSMYAVRTVGATLSSWTRPSLLDTVPGWGGASLLLQTGPKSLGLFFNSEVNNDFTTLYRKDFNEVTKTWGPKQEVTVVTRSFLNYSGMIGNYNNGVTTLMATYGIYAQGTTLIRALYIVNGITQPVIERTLEGGQDSTPLVIGARADGSIYLGWAGQSAAPHLSIYRDGAEVSGEDIPTGLTRAYGLAALSPSGNIFFHFNHYSPSQVYLTMTYRGALAPTATGTPLIKGTSKVGKKLVATLPVFSSPSGIGISTMQWYSCNAPITVIHTSIPAGCLPITKANTATFKLTTKQKKKYLGFAVTNTNPVGAATIFGKTTARIK